MFALHQSVKVFSQVFFKKLAGLGSAHNYGAFFLPSFFFAPLVPKKKRDCEVLCFLGGEENFLKKAFLPRTPSFKNFETGGYFFAIISALAQNSYNTTVEHVILSGEDDTVCHFRSRTRPKGGREAGSIMSKHLFRPRSQIMLRII